MSLVNAGEVRAFFMSKPEFDRPDKDSESMFDFLREGETEKGAREKVRKRPPQEGGNRPLPVIRKPVPISESGPLLPPKPGAPVEPPPRLTDNPFAKPEDEFGFLDDISLDDTGKRRRTGPLTGPATRPSPGFGPEVVPGAANVTPLYPDRGTKSTPLDLDDLHLDDTAEFDRVGTAERREPSAVSASGEHKPLRWLAIGVAVLLIGAGVSSFLVTDPMGLSSGSDPRIATPEPDSAPISTEQTPERDIATAPPSGGLQISPMFQAYKEQLTTITSLIDSGKLDEAEQVLTTMDPFVYGYGSEEFQAQETRIARIRSGEITPDTLSEAQIAVQQAQADAEREARELAEVQAAEERLQQQREAEQAAEAQRLEEQREAQQAAEARRQEEQRQAAAAEAERLEKLREAELAEAERLNQQRLAEEAERAEAEREEQQRLAAQAEREAAIEQEQQRAAERAAQEEAARVEQERLAELARQQQEERRVQAQEAEAERLEQQRQAERAAADEARQREQARLAEVEDQRQAQAQLQAEQRQREASERQRIDEANRRATDRQIAEQRAAAQRQQAREQRLIDARERERAREAAAAIAAEQQGTSPASPDLSGGPVARADQSISEEELELVYRRFANLQQAIRDRDINAVISLTRRSGARVQQFMQVFENSVQIDARIRNVSTSNATGEINATLQINGVRRPDGSVVKPPADLKSISISSKRDANGWSAIRW